MSDETFTSPLFDGDTVTVDGIEYKASIVPDDMSIMDEQGEGMWCGRIEWARNNDYGPVCPSHFVNGRSEILDRDRNMSLWWECPSDVAHTEHRRELRRAICDLMEYGYAGVIVESSDGHSEALGGIGATDHECHADVANEALWELLADRRDRMAIVNADVDRWVTVGLS